MLSLIFAVVIAMSAISVNTLAATILDIKDGSTNKLYVDWYSYSYNFNGRLNTSTYGQIIKLNVGSSTGQVAYCIQSSKDAWTVDYTAQDYYDDLSRAQRLNLKHALIYGYQGTTKYGYSADTERIATQIVIWNICDGWFNNSSESTAVGVFTEGMSSSMATNVKVCYNKIKEQMLSHTTIPSYAVGNAPMKGNLKIVKRSADGALSGWKFEVSGTALNGTPVATKTYTTDAKGEINISGILIGDYTVKEVIDGKTVGYITPANQTVKIDCDTVSIAEFENKPFGHIIINKVDAKTGEKVTGASFGIFTDSACKTVAKAYKSETDSSLVNAVITEIENGKYTCNFLPIGNAEGTVYYIKELTAPDGYYLDKNTYAVVLKTANATVSIDNEFGKSDFNEYPYGHATIIKEWKLDNSTADMTADEIAQMKAELEKGLYFTVKNSNGKYITATGADGVYKYNSESATEFRYILKNGAFVIAELPTGEYTSAMTGNTLICPLCGKPVIKKKVGWCCTGYSKDNPDSCKFYIANEICGKKISDVIAKELTLKRATSIIKGFTSQSGKTFDAKLTIKDDNTIGFEFPERLKCPICGKEMVKSSKGWVCTGYRSGCSFFIAGTICGKCITETIAAMLCANKRTRIINGFTSKAGKAFSAALVVKDGKIDFDFPAKSQKRNK